MSSFKLLVVRNLSSTDFLFSLLFIFIHLFIFLFSISARGHYGEFHGEKNVGFMFLVEVALGKEKSISQCDPSLTQPPPGFNCVVARGSSEPGESIAF